MRLLLAHIFRPRRPLPIAWTFVILTYLFVEWVYNQHLLELLQYPSVTAKQFSWTEMFGKAIAAVGLNLVLAKCYRRPGIIKFLVGGALAYVALTWLFDRVIASFPDAFRHSSYYGVMHRKSVVEGRDTGTVLAFSNKEPWHVRPLVLSQYYLTLQDTQWAQLESRLRTPLDKQANNALKDKKGLWEKYSQAERIRQYVDSGWDSYQDAMRQYNRYRDNPRYAQKAHATFLSRVGAPPGLDRDQFVEKKAGKYHEFLNTVLVQGNEQAGVATLRGRDLPLRMNESTFYQYVDSTVRSIRTAVAPGAQEIRGNAASLDAVALLVIPPLSIGLSLLSIAINLVGLACAWISVFLPGGWVRRATCLAICAAAVLGAGIAYVSQPHATRIDGYWAHLDTTFEKSHPVIWAAMSIPMRLEPLLCITQQPVGWIREGMARVYKPKA